MNDRKRDAIWGGFFMALAAAIYVLIPSQIADVKASGVGPRTFPYFLAVLLFLLGAVMLAQSLLALRRSPAPASEAPAEPAPSSAAEDAPENGRHISGFWFAMLVFVWFVAYAVAMQFVGYILASLVFLGGLMVLFGLRKWQYYVTFAALVLVVYVIFSNFLYVQLP